MKIISSQHYLNEEIVEQKKKDLITSGATVVSIPCWYAGQIDDGYDCEEYAVVSDHHHLLAAVREIGIKVQYDIIPDPEGLEGQELLDARYLDGDYYDVETSDPLNYVFNLIW